MALSAGRWRWSPAGRKRIFILFFRESTWLTSGVIVHSANGILFLRHHPDMWAQYVRNRINAYLVRHLLELQNVTPRVIDLRFKNIT
jgi:hypothetical protein